MTKEQTESPILVAQRMMADGATRMDVGRYLTRQGVENPSRVATALWMAARCED